MTPISVVVITYNEEKNLARCLSSVKEIADDIIVLDSFSTDKTQEIAEANGARFFQHNFDGHIEQKNRAITFAKYPHILSLDADEALDETLLESIKKAKENFIADGYYINRLTNYCGQWIKHSGWYPDKKLRLWDSRKGKWGGTNPHDKYELQAGSKIEQLKGDILHYSFYSVNQHLQQVNKFTDIAAKAMCQKGEKSSKAKIIYKPTAKFIRNYFLKLGFLDGFYGYIICSISAYATFLRYVKLYFLKEQNEG